MADIRAIGTAVESYGVDHNRYPPGSTTIEDIRNYLVPVHIKELPGKDSWGNDYLYESDGISYTITSYGKDRHLDNGLVYRGAITRFTNDIRFSLGSFVSFPEGT